VFDRWQVQFSTQTGNTLHIPAKTLVQTDLVVLDSGRRVGVVLQQKRVQSRDPIPPNG